MTKLATIRCILEHLYPYPTSPVHSFLKFSHVIGTLSSYNRYLTRGKEAPFNVKSMYTIGEGERGGELLCVYWCVINEYYHESYSMWLV